MAEHDSQRLNTIADRASAPVENDAAEAARRVRGARATALAVGLIAFGVYAGFMLLNFMANRA